MKKHSDMMSTLDDLSLCLNNSVTRDTPIPPYNKPLIRAMEL